MILSAAATVGFIGFFLLLGYARPRVQPPVDWSATGLNVLTGAAMYGVRTLVLFAVAPLVANLGGALIDLSAITHPAVQALLVFLLLDFTRYWVHYADHRVPQLWSFHRTHHSSEHLNASSGLRMHLVDIVQLTLIPVTLFGILFDISSFHERVLPSVLLIGAFFDAFEHANLSMDMTRPYNRAWNLLLNNPHFHSWHHTRDGSKKDGNYGQTLTLWDRMFGTDVTEPLPPDLYGLEDSQALEHSPLGMQLLRPRTR